MGICNITLKKCKNGKCACGIQNKSIRFGEALNAAVRKSRAADAQLEKLGKKPVFMTELNKILSPLQLVDKCPADRMRLAENTNRLIDFALKETGLDIGKTQECCGPLQSFEKPSALHIFIKSQDSIKI